MTLEFISQAGLLGVGALAVFLAYKYFNNKLIESPVSNPRKHRFFNLVTYELLNRIPYINLYHNGQYCRGRTLVFRDMLRIKFEHWEDGLKNAMIDGEDNLTDSELQALLEKATIDFVGGYRKEWRETLDIDGKYLELITSKFSEWHQAKVEMYMEAIRGICQGNSFSSAREKANAFLELNCSMLVLTIIDAERSLGELNGELTGAKYKGHTIL